LKSTKVEKIKQINHATLSHIIPYF